MCASTPAASSLCGLRGREPLMRRIICAAAVAAALGLGTSGPAHADEISVSTSEGVRTAIVLPAKRPRAPTVIVLHGALVSAESTASWYGFAGAAERRGF